MESMISVSPPRWGSVWDCAMSTWLSWEPWWQLFPRGLKVRIGQKRNLSKIWETEVKQERGEGQETFPCSQTWWRWHSSTDPSRCWLPSAPHLACPPDGGFCSSRAATSPPQMLGCKPQRQVPHRGYSSPRSSPSNPPLAIHLQRLDVLSFPDLTASSELPIWATASGQPVNDTANPPAPSPRLSLPHLAQVCNKPAFQGEPNLQLLLISVVRILPLFKPSIWSHWTWSWEERRTSALRSSWASPSSTPNEPLIPWHSHGCSLSWTELGLIQPDYRVMGIALNTAPGTQEMLNKLKLVGYRNQPSCCLWFQTS